MNPYPATLRFTVLLAAAVVFGERADAQPARPVSINPATGMPAVPGSKPIAIDPATGLTVLPAPARTAPPDTGLSSAASAETWAPETNSDLRKVLDQAKLLSSMGQYEQALQRYIWFHNHGQESGDSYQTVLRVTSGLSGWAELGRRYPKAKQALLEIRDKKTREIAEGRGYSELIRDVQAINRELQDDDATYALFTTLREKDPKLAGQIYPYVEDQLMSKGEYEYCLSNMGDPQGRFDMIRRRLDLERDSLKRNEETRKQVAQQVDAIYQQRGYTNSWARPDLASRVKKGNEDRFVGHTRQLMEILLATGHKAEAESIRDQAIAILDDPRLKSAISDLEEKIRKRPKVLPAHAAALSPATGMPVPSRASPAPNPATGLAAPPPPSRFAPSETDFLTGTSLARELMNRGRFEQALQTFLSYHSQTRGTLTNGPLVTALSDWVELGQRYPKAKQALLDIRDGDIREFVEGRGDTKLFSELAEINTALREPDSTYALFLGLEQSDAALARECYRLLEPALVERGEYEVCARYLSNPQTWLDITRRTFEMGQGHAQHMAEWNQESARRLDAITQTNHWPRPKLPIHRPEDAMRTASTNGFVRAVVPVLEILVAAGRQAEAEKFRAQALAAVDDPRLRPAISGVEARVRAAQASHRPPPAPLAIHTQFVESSTLFPPELPAPSASVEHWSPRLQPGTKPDLHAILSAAKAYTAENRYEESLQHHLWYHNHALEYEPEAQRGVRLGALRDWATLGRKYPKAREALLEIRDRDLHEFAQGRGSVALFKDIAAINEQWGHESTTCRLFKYLKDQQTELATRCYPTAEDALVKKGEYALCLAYIGDGQARFKVHCRNWEQQAKYEQHARQIMQQSQKKMDEYRAQKGQTRPAGRSFIPPPAADNILIGDTRQLIEILVCAGHKADAEKIRTQALALVDDPRLKSAISDAEKKIGK